MLVSLYTVRVVLNVLGTEDYGIYNVVAGIVTMFSFLSGAMATASQRYFSIELGYKNKEQLKKLFSVSFISYIILSLLIVIIAETLGLWFLNIKLVIPHDRIFAAKIVYHTTIVSLFFTMITTPYMALIISYEEMDIYAYISIIEVIFKLLIVYLLKIVQSIDKLIVYGILSTSITIIITTIYRGICKKKYEETHSGFYWDKKMFYELLNYTGWNIFGASVGVFKIQGVNIILNQFFNPIIIASRSIAVQVNSAVTSFTQNFSTALRPHIVKSNASDNHDKVLMFVFKSCKITFSLIYFLALPLCFEMQFVLNIWLKNPPEYSIIFTRLAIIEAVIESISYPIMALAQATGNIKLYQSLVGSILLLNLPLAWLFLKIGSSPLVVFVISIILTLIALLARLFVLVKLINLKVLEFIKYVIIPIAIYTVLSLIVPTLIYIKFSGKIIRFITIVFASFVSCIILFYFIFMDKDERKHINKYLSLRKIK
jgi:O-antigen/teichoic acid export membrane protein